MRKLLVALAVFVLLVGGFVAWIWHGTPAKHSVSELSGTDPVLVDSPRAESIPSVSIAEPIGWAANEAPVAAQGLTVARYAEGLDHPRTMLALPNGDILVAETRDPPAEGGGLLGVIQDALMSRAGATGASANTIVLLRDADGDGKAEARFDLRKEGLSSPSGMAWGNGKLYIANHDAVLAFDYALGETALASKPIKLMDLPPAGNHWMRNLLLSPDGKKLYVAVGSSSNIAENGIEKEQGRAAIWEIDVASGSHRQFASGLRNPNGLAWNPSTGELWTTVNERDQLGPDLVPDYLTNVPVGAHYGWPWMYYKTFTDERVQITPPEFLADYIRKPEYALGAHVAALGLAFDTGGHRLGAGFSNGAFIARHGSWNRKPLTGYDVVFVRFDANGNPKGLPIPVLSGFLTGKGTTHGRPTWVAWEKSGGLLVSDDTAGIIWRVIASGAAPSAAPKFIASTGLPPVKDLKGDPDEARYSASFKKDEGEGQ